MSRNVQLQVLRGTFAQLQTLIGGIDPDTGAQTLPLQMGEPYFATDQGNFYFGTPGYGVGYVQVGDTTQVNETLKQMLVVMESMRRAVVALACEGKRNDPRDFDLAFIDREIQPVDDVLSGGN